MKARIVLGALIGAGVGLALVSTPAFAQHRDNHGRHRGHQAFSRPGYYHAPPRRYRRHRRWGNDYGPGNYYAPPPVVYGQPQPFGGLSITFGMP